jgi:hypothetical protein
MDTDTVFSTNRWLLLLCFSIRFPPSFKFDDFLICLIIGRKSTTGQKSRKIARKQKNRPGKLHFCNFSGRQRIKLCYRRS